MQSDWTFLEIMNNNPKTKRIEQRMTAETVAEAEAARQTMIRKYGEHGFEIYVGLTQIPADQPITA